MINRGMYHRELWNNILIVEIFHVYCRDDIILGKALIILRYPHQICTCTNIKSIQSPANIIYYVVFYREYASRTLMAVSTNIHDSPSRTPSPCSSLV